MSVEVITFKAEKDLIDQVKEHCGLEKTYSSLSHAIRFALVKLLDAENEKEAQAN